MDVLKCVLNHEKHSAQDLQDYSEDIFLHGLFRIKATANSISNESKEVDFQAYTGASCPVIKQGESLDAFEYFSQPEGELDDFLSNACTLVELNKAILPPLCLKHTEKECSKESHVVLISHGCHEGYCKIAVPSKHEVISKHWENFLRREKYKRPTYFIGRSFKSLIPIQGVPRPDIRDEVSSLYNIENVFTQKTGPAIQTSVLMNKAEKPYMYPLDTIPCLHVEKWPPQADEWKTRNRDHGWPSTEVIEDIVSNGCHVVGACHPTSTQPEIEWKFSFSLADIALTKTLNSTQKLLYSLFKTIVKCNLQISIIKSDHLKSIFYKYIEKKEAESWRTLSLKHHIAGLLADLQKSAENECLAHYFICKNNIMSEIPIDDLKMVVNKCCYAINNIYMIFREIVSELNLREKQGAKLHKELNFLTMPSNYATTDTSSFLKNYKNELFKFSVQATDGKLATVWLSELAALISEPHNDLDNDQTTQLLFINKTILIQLILLTKAYIIYRKKCRTPRTEHEDPQPMFINMFHTSLCCLLDGGGVGKNWITSSAVQVIRQTTTNAKSCLKLNGLSVLQSVALCHYDCSYEATNIALELMRKWKETDQIDQCTSNKDFEIHPLNENMQAICQESLEIPNKAWIYYKMAICHLQLKDKDAAKIDVEDLMRVCKSHDFTKCVLQERLDYYWLCLSALYLLEVNKHESEYFQVLRSALGVKCLMLDDPLDVRNYPPWCNMSDEYFGRVISVEAMDDKESPMNRPSQGELWILHSYLCKYDVFEVRELAPWIDMSDDEYARVIYHAHIDHLGHEAGNHYKLLAFIWIIHLSSFKYINHLRMLEPWCDMSTQEYVQIIKEALHTDTSDPVCHMKRAYLLGIHLSFKDDMELVRCLSPWHQMSDEGLAKVCEYYVDNTKSLSGENRLYNMWELQSSLLLNPLRIRSVEPWSNMTDTVYAEFLWEEHCFVAGIGINVNKSSREYLEAQEKVWELQDQILRNDVRLRQVQPWCDMSNFDYVATLWRILGKSLVDLDHNSKSYNEIMKNLYARQISVIGNEGVMRTIIPWREMSATEFAEFIWLQASEEAKQPDNWHRLWFLFNEFTTDANVVRKMKPWSSQTTEEYSSFIWKIYIIETAKYDIQFQNEYCTKLTRLVWKHHSMITDMPNMAECWNFLSDDHLEAMAKCLHNEGQFRKLDFNTPHFELLDCIFQRQQNKTSHILALKNYEPWKTMTQKDFVENVSILCVGKVKKGDDKNHPAYLDMLSIAWDYHMADMGDLADSEQLYKVSPWCYADNMTYIAVIIQRIMSEFLYSEHDQDYIDVMKLTWELQTYITKNEEKILIMPPWRDMSETEIVTITNACESEDITDFRPWKTMHDIINILYVKLLKIRDDV